MNAPDPTEVLARLWRSAGHDDAALGAGKLTGDEPALPSSFAVGTASAGARSLRTGRRCCW